MNGRQSLYPKRVIMHLDEQTLGEVDAYASAKRITRAEAMRQLLRSGLRQDSAQTEK